jgi:hypothetical protein
MARQASSLRSNGSDACAGLVEGSRTYSTGRAASSGCACRRNSRSAVDPLK